MSRSVKKGPYVEERLSNRIDKMNESGEKKVIKTWSRSSTILPTKRSGILSIPLCPSTTTQQPCGQLSLRVVQSAVQQNTFSQLWGVRTPEEAKAKIDEYFDYKFGRLD